jgi:hypothetical protein
LFPLLISLKGSQVSAITETKVGQTKKNTNCKLLVRSHGTTEL